MWLQDSLPHDLNHQVRIITYGYNTTLSEATGRADSLEELVEEFARVLLNARSKVPNSVNDSPSRH